MNMEIDLDMDEELMASPMEFNEMRWKSLITDILKDLNSSNEPERLLEPQFWKMMIKSSKVAAQDPNFENDDYLTKLSERMVNVILSHPFNGEICQILAHNPKTDRSDEFQLLCEKMRFKREQKMDADNGVEDEVKQKRGIPWRQSKQILKSQNSSTFYTTNDQRYSPKRNGSPSLDGRGDNDAMEIGNGDTSGISKPSGDQNSDSSKKKRDVDPDRSPKPPNSMKITLLVRSTINNSLSKKETDVVARFAGYSITSGGLSNFKIGRQLDDVPIDFYMELIKARNNKAGSLLPKVFVLPIHCFSCFKNHGYDSAVSDCVPKSDNLFNYDLVFIPLHLMSPEHWILVVLDIQQKSLTCYDSLGNDQTESLNMVDEYLLYELNKNLPPGAQPLDRDWTVQNPLEPVPRQENGWDCGVFCLQFAEYLSRRKSFDFRQKHMTYFRKRMAYEIIRCQILT